MSRTRSLVLVVCLFAVIPSDSFAAWLRDQGGMSSDRVWSRDVARRDTVRVRRGRLPHEFHLFKADYAMLRERLRSAPDEVLSPVSATKAMVEPQRGATFSLPMPDGRLVMVEVESSPILSPALQAQYPELRTYTARGIDDPLVVARLDETPLGFHAIISSADGISYIDPVEAASADHYISYWRRDLDGVPSFQCLYDPNERVEIPARGLRSETHANPSGTELRTYRLAVSATGEYTTNFGGVSQAAAQITTTFNRVTFLYERDLAIRFNVTATRIFDDPDTDPFTPGEIDTWRDQNQTTLDGNPGSGNYDIGHSVSAGGTGGKACIGCVCGGNKAKGATSLGNPVGDPFDVDFVAHEIGHQMGGHHTFDGTNDGNCNDNRVGSSAYEPGSGTTIMAYAGVCGPGNVQPNSDALFHSRSFDQIKAVRDSAGCGTTVATGNSVPVPNAGPDYTIPQLTPFTLTGSAGDANSDALTYAWEQYDLGSGIAAPTMTYGGPLFRSYLPSSSVSRTIPRMQDLLSGAATPWEVLPGINRDMNFRFTARDNRLNGGGSDYDSMVVHVNGAPFVVTSPVGGDILQCGRPFELLWNVGGGSGDPNVRALLSTNNGASFPVTLLASTPNDGSENFTMPPGVKGTQSWIMLEPLGNIYFSLRGAFRIHDTLDPDVTAPANLANVECTQCSPRGATPSIGAATASDACDLTPAISNNAPSVFPLGTTPVQWSATDDDANVGTDTQTVQVVDTTPPTLSAPAAVTAECTGPAGTPVDLGTASANDICWCSAVSLANDAPPVFPLGSTTVTWSATDGSGNVTTGTQVITVQDTTPPELAVAVTPSILWPVNHSLIRIQVDIATSDVCDDSPSVRLISITSNEPDNGLGDGNTSGDIQGAAFGTDDREFFLRAERDGRGTGRTYTIVYESRDDSGNFTLREAVVTVPRDRR